MIEEADQCIVPHANWAVEHGVQRVVILSNDTDVVVLMLRLGPQQPIGEKISTTHKKTRKGTDFVVKLCRDIGIAVVGSGEIKRGKYTPATATRICARVQQSECFRTVVEYSCVQVSVLSECFRTVVEYSSVCRSPCRNCCPVSTSAWNGDFFLGGGEDKAEEDEGGEEEEEELLPMAE
ncbi:UNVERIFIED_CONTAM: hypothetical protein FKN15_040624 [Acipenser sinensis]